MSAIFPCLDRGIGKEVIIPLSHMLASKPTVEVKLGVLRTGRATNVALETPDDGDLVLRTTLDAAKIK